MGIAVMNGRMFVVGGFSGKAFLESIEYLSEDAHEWCIYQPSGEKMGTGSSTGDGCEYQTSESEGRSSDGEDVHNGKTIEENGHAYGGSVVEFSNVLGEGDNDAIDCDILANGENGYCEEISNLEAIQDCDHITKPEMSNHDESHYDNGIESDCRRSSETDLEGNGFI